MEHWGEKGKNTYLPGKTADLARFAHLHKSSGCAIITATQ